MKWVILSRVRVRVSLGLGVAVSPVPVQTRAWEPKVTKGEVIVRLFPSNQTSRPSTRFTIASGKQQQTLAPKSN